METNSNLFIPQDNNLERMSSVTIDLEARQGSHDNLIQQNSLHIPLKGILKNPNESIIEHKIIEQRLYKICLCLFVIVLITPIMFCDLYFGFTDNSCSKEEPDELAISLKLYLLVSGFKTLALLFGILVTIIFYDMDGNLYDYGICILCFTSFILILIALFNLIWDILGAVVFWAYIYGNGNCNKTFSTYVFISLIIKLVCNIIGTQFNNKKKDKN